MTVEHLRLDALRTIATAAGGRPHLWGDLVRHDPLERSYARVTGTDEYDVWVLGWDLDQGVELHDHGGAAGALFVVEGLLAERFTSFPGPATTRERRLGPGEAVAFDPRHVHDVWNPGPAQSTSVHVYSPPLESMTFFGPDSVGSLTAVRSEPAHASRPQELAGAP